MVCGAAFPTGPDKVWPGNLQRSTIGLWIARLTSLGRPLPHQLNEATYPRSLPRKGDTLQRNWLMQGRPTGCTNPVHCSQMDAQAAQV